VNTLHRLMAPVERAVSLTELKLGLKIDTAYLCDEAAGAEDASLALVLDAAIDECQERMHRAILPQTWQMTLSRFPAALLLPYPRARAATVEYQDSAGSWTVLAPDEYDLIDTEPARIIPAYGTDWPATLARAGAVRVTWQCWTWSQPADVAAGVKQWIIARAGELRLQVERSGPVTMHYHTFIDALLGPYQVAHYDYCQDRNAR
jgi:uncharacterized phiE125 gp8 family phage protein